MKIGKVVAVLLVAALAVTLFVTSIFGVYTQYGDTTFTQVLSIKDIKPGLELDGEAALRFTAAEGAEITADELYKAKSVYEQRLSSLNFPDFEVFADEDGKALTVVFAHDHEDAFAVSEIVDLLSAKGLLEIRLGRGDEVASDAPVLDNSAVKSAKSSAESVFGISTQYSVNVVLSSKGASALKKAANALEGDEKYFSVWLDGEQVSSHKVEENTDFKNIKITKYDYDETTVFLDTVYVASGALPVAMEGTGEYTTFDSPSKLNLTAAAAVAGISVLLCVLFLIIRYRAVGIAYAVGFIGVVGALAALLTGYFKGFTDGFVTPSLIMTALAMAAFALLLSCRDCERIRRNLIETGAPEKAADTAFKENLKSSLLVLAVVIALGILFGGAFSRTESGIASLLGSKAYFGFMSGAGRIIAGGALFCLLFTVFGARVILKNLCALGCVSVPKSSAEKNKAAPKNALKIAFAAVVITAGLAVAFTAGFSPSRSSSGASFAYAPLTTETEGYTIDMDAVTTSVNGVLGGSASAQKAASASGYGDTLLITAVPASDLDLAAVSKAITDEFPEIVVGDFTQNSAAPSINTAFFGSFALCLAAALAVAFIFFALFFSYKRAATAVSAVVGIIVSVLLTASLAAIARVPADRTLITALVCAVLLAAAGCCLALGECSAALNVHKKSNDRYDETLGQINKQFLSFGVAAALLLAPAIGGAVYLGSPLLAFYAGSVLLAAESAAYASSQLAPRLLKAFSGK